jgi:hypothetical protein
LSQVTNAEETHMVGLLHEVWVDTGESGAELEGCCFAGPDGDEFRRLLQPSARLVHTFQAGSHFEAMSTYHRILGREPYASELAQDHEPYPAEWLDRQNSGKSRR